MPKAYSADMRERVIAGSQAARRGVRRRNTTDQRQHSGHMDECFRETGTLRRETAGRQPSPLEAHADFLLGLIADQSDLTLDEVVSAMRKRRIAAVALRRGASSSATGSRLKKSLHAAEQERADVARARRRWMREQGMFDPARLVFIDETAANNEDGAAERPLRRAASASSAVCRTATGRR